MVSFHQRLKALYRVVAVWGLREFESIDLICLKMKELCINRKEKPQKRKAIITGGGWL